MSSRYVEDPDKSYVSVYDLFLEKFDEEHPEKSASQKKEIEKHRRIAEKRDKK